MAGGQSHWWRWAPVILLVGFAPLIYWHLAGLLQKPHYQFLYLLPFVAFLFRADAGAPDGDTVSPRAMWFALGSLLLGFFLLGFATLFWSPWIACAGLLLSFPGVLVLVGGWAMFRRWYACWVFFFILLPIPFGGDEVLIVRLRHITTRGASAALDQIGVLHDSYANIIQLPSKPLFIADACSGIHSLYVLVAAALLLVTYLKRGVLHGLALLTCTVGLVLAENVLRIVAVAKLWDWGYDYSLGFKHELLGGVLFVLSLVVLVSTDQMLLFLLPRGLPSAVSVVDRYFGGIRSGRRPGQHSRPQILLAIVCCFPVLGVWQLTRLPESTPMPLVANFDQFVLPQFDAGTVPEQYGGYVRADFVNVERIPGDPFGRSSQQWTFRQSDVAVLFSVDYPYAEIHNLCECYVLTGWTARERGVFAEADLLDLGLEENLVPVAVAQMFRPTFGHGVLIFNAVDGSGETVTKIRSDSDSLVDDKARGRLEALWGDSVKVPTQLSLTEPFVQFQLLARFPVKPSDKQLSDLLRLFLECRSRLLTEIQRGNLWEGLE